MKNVSNLTIIRGNGEGFEVVMNGIVNEEIKRMRQRDLAAMEIQRNEFKNEMEWMNMIKKQRDRLLEEKYIAMKTQRHKPTRNEIVREKIGFALACILCWGEELGLWEYIGDEEEWR